MPAVRERSLYLRAHRAELVLQDTREQNAAKKQQGAKERALSLKSEMFGKHETLPLSNEASTGRCR